MSRHCPQLAAFPTVFRQSSVASEPDICPRHEVLDPLSCHEGIFFGVTVWCAIVAPFHRQMKLELGIIKKFRQCHHMFVGLPKMFRHLSHDSYIYNIYIYIYIKTNICPNISAMMSMSKCSPIFLRWWTKQKTMAAALWLFSWCSCGWSNPLLSTGSCRSCNRVTSSW